MNVLMSAIGGISDDHIKEFAFEQVPKRTIPLWLKAGSLVAGIGLVTLTILSVVGRIDAFISPNSSDDISGGGMIAPDNSGNVMPTVVLKGKIYVMADEYPVYTLPEDYVLVGEVTSNDKFDMDKDGYSWGCNVGDKIYQKPTDIEDVFVKTTFLTDTNEYWYIRFVDVDYFRRLKG